MCTNGAQHPQNDDTDLPVDGKDCTNDVCTNGNASNPPVSNGTACAQDGGKICYVGNCVDCYDNTQCTPNDTCGGGGTPYVCGCTPTACDNLTCGFATDNKCDQGATLDCNNPVQDGTETDVNCGGPQPPVGTCSLLCQNGKHCVDGPRDCASGVCNGGCCTACPDAGSGGAGGSG
jgi:hypothetical protein